MKPRQPLLQDPELDYFYESDGDWESEIGGGDIAVNERPKSNERTTKKRKLEQIVHYRAVGIGGHRGGRRVL